MNWFPDEVPKHGRVGAMPGWFAQDRFQIGICQGKSRKNRHFLALC